MAVEAGQQAPDFDLQVNADTRVRLEDFRGEKNVLLVFHPYAFTGICEAESCDIQDNLERYREAETEVVFVSCDPWPARQAWKKELGHDYTFASDFWPHGAAAQAYGVFDEARGHLRARHVPDRQGRRRQVGARPRARRAARVARGGVASRGRLTRAAARRTPPTRFRSRGGARSRGRCRTRCGAARSRRPGCAAPRRRGGRRRAGSPRCRG